MPSQTNDKPYVLKANKIMYLIRIFYSIIK